MTEKISIHALREEGDRILWEHWKEFMGISIHALREEGDQGANSGKSWQELFLSTPSARRATSIFSSCLHACCDFYPRPPRGGRRQQPELVYNMEQISIHALREEGDQRAEF